MPSPRPRPAKLKLLNGRTPGHDSGGRAVAPTPAFARVAPQKPETLSAEAAAHWDDVVPELARLELISPANVGGLTALCEAWARYIEALDLIQSEGLVQNAGQRVYRHPAAAIANEASREYRMWCDEFGLTPSSEGKVMVKEGKREDDANPFAPRSSTVG